LSRAFILARVSFAEDIDSLHHPWLLPFEVVDLAPHLEMPEWGVVMDDGNVLQPSQRWIYAVVARINGGDHVLCAEPELCTAATEFLAAQPDPRAAWLLRIERASSTVDVFRGPEDIAPRPVRERDIALLMDYGRVLCHFDYGWYTQGHIAVFGQEPDPLALMEVENMRPAFDAGDIDEEAFFEFACKKLNIIAADRKLFESAWTNILRLNEDMVALIRRAVALDGWEMSIVSNIDPIMVRESRHRYGLEDLFKGGVFSHVESVRPKHEDGSMWRLAERGCALRLGNEPALTVATDDVPENLITADQEPGVHCTITFRNPFQWWYELGAAGAYLPRSR
jgi:FMN phosphatase YigB (HAD superfamily)